MQIPTIPRTVLLLPQPANSIQSAKVIFLFKDIVQYPTQLLSGHHPNYFSEKRFVRHSIFDLWYSVKSQVLIFVVRNHDRLVRDRFFDEGLEVFVRQYQDPRKWAGGQSLSLSGPLSYDVLFGAQVYSRHASQLLQNRTGHQDLSDSQHEQLLDYDPPQNHSGSQDAGQPEAHMQIPKSTSNTNLQSQPQRSTSDSVS